MDIVSSQRCRVIVAYGGKVSGNGVWAKCIVVVAGWASAVASAHLDMVEAEEAAKRIRAC